MATFLLIPGAGADPRVWGMTIEALRQLGHEGIAPELPLDDEATPSDHAAAVVAAAPEGEELVIVGQSLGAYAATIAAERLRPRHLILLAPMIPKPGEPAAEWGGATRQEEVIASLIERLGPPDEWSEEAIAEVFLHDVDPAVAAANSKYDGAPAAGLFAEPLPMTEWPEVATTVLVGRDDRLFPLEFQRRVARERLGHGVEEIDGGHVPYLARPVELARRLVEVAGVGEAGREYQTKAGATDPPPAPRPYSLDHMTLPVADLEASLRFYRAALVEGLGWVEIDEEGLPTFGPEGGEDISLAPGGPTVPPLHLAFVATSRAQIERFYAHGLAAGGRDNGAPGPRPRYSPGYHGAFLLDPDGHNVEAVYHQPLDD